MLPLAKQQDFFYKPESYDEDQTEQTEQSDVDRLLNGKEEEDFEVEEEEEGEVEKLYKATGHQQDVELACGLQGPEMENGSSSASPFDELILEEEAAQL